MINKQENLTKPLCFTIPLAPITKKNSQQIITNPRTKRPMIIPSARFRQYEKDSGPFLRGKFNQIADPVNVKAIYYMPTKRKVDLTNLHEALHDVLVHYKVLEDDDSMIIVSTDGSRVKYDKHNPRTEVEITPAKGEPCQVIMGVEIPDDF